MASYLQPQRPRQWQRRNYHPQQVQVFDIASNDGMELQEEYLTSSGSNQATEGFWSYRSEVESAVNRPHKQPYTTGFPARVLSIVIILIRSCLSLSYLGPST